MKLMDLVCALDLDQKIVIQFNDMVVYSGALEDMQAGQLLLLRDYEVSRIKDDNGITIELIQ